MTREGDTCKTCFYPWEDCVCNVEVIPEEPYNEHEAIGNEADFAYDPFWTGDPKE